MRIDFLEEVVSKVIGLPQEGKNWEKEFDMKKTRVQFNTHQYAPLDINKKQGTSRLSLLMEFIQPNMFIIMYFMCKGCYK